MCTWVAVCMQAQMYMFASVGQKRASDPLELDYKLFVSHLKPVLGTELWFSAASAPNC